MQYRQKKNIPTPKKLYGATAALVDRDRRLWLYTALKLAEHWEFGEFCPSINIRNFF